MIIAVALVLLVVGSVVFHFLSPWYLTELASNWSTIDDTITITFWVTGFVFVAVNLFMAYAIIRYRYNRDRRSHYEPENRKLEWWLIGITTVGVAAMLAPGLFVWGEFVNPPDDAHEVEALGQQWHWSYRFPGEDGEFGATDARLMSDDNPFGMQPDDPRGQDDLLVESPELRLPLDRPVKMLLRSKDVLHNFAVAQFRVKMDLVPGVVSYLWLTPTRTGAFDVLCEELCGVGHHTMRGRVVVTEPDAFDTWLAAQPTYAEFSNQPVADVDAGRAHFTVCAACHGADGMGNPDLNAPKIAGQEPWYLRRQIEYYRSGVRGSHPDDLYGKQMAPMVATLTSDKAVNDVAAYVAALPDHPARITISGDAERGRRIFRTCAACHGAEGQGIKALNAPRQAGMSDWYLVTQLQNFKRGVRGAHPDDMYGFQMVEMAKVVATDQAVHDVVAYINTLPTPTDPQIAMAPAETVGTED